MAEITASKNNIQIEEVSYKSSISEATGFKLGAAINFINNRQYDTKQFNLNGTYSYPGVGLDGAYGVLWDCEIVGCMMFNLVAGTSGTTTLDLKRYTASDTGGTSIFGTKPAISYTAGNNAFVFQRFIDGTTLENPTGTTLPVLNSTQLNAGDMLVLELTAYQAGAKNCGLMLFTRPR